MQSLHQHPVLISPAELASVETVLTKAKECAAAQDPSQRWMLLQAADTVSSWIAAVQSTMLQTWLGLPHDDPARIAYAEEASHWARHSEALIHE